MIRNAKSRRYRLLAVALVCVTVPGTGSGCGSSQMDGELSGAARAAIVQRKVDVKDRVFKGTKSSGSRPGAR